MTYRTKPPELPARPKINGLHRTVIALAPLFISYGILFFMPNSGSNGDNWILICMGLVAIGAILAGIFVVISVRRDNPQAHPVLLIMLFVGIVLAYLSISVVGGCFIAVAGSGMGR